MNSVEVVIGKNGLGKKCEGDGKSPEGIFPLGFAFGTEHFTNKIAFPYQQIGKNDIWIDDPESPDYNRLILNCKDSDSKYKSYEKLAIPEYKYAINIDVNPENISGKGSAIFLHIWKNADSATEGCTAMSERNLLRILKWLEADSHPVFIQGLHKDLDKLFLKGIN